MPKHTKPTDSAAEYRAAKAAHAAAEAAYVQTDRARSESPTGGLDWSQPLAERKAAKLEALVALEDVTERYNESATDISTVRAFLLRELAAARPAFVAAETAAAFVGLTGLTPEALEARVTEIANPERAASRERARTAAARLAAAYTTAREAMVLIHDQRSAAGLPAPPLMVPDAPGGVHAASYAPVSAAEIDRDARALESIPMVVRSNAAFELAMVRAEIEDHVERQAAAE